MSIPSKVLAYQWPYRRAVAQCTLPEILNAMKALSLIEEDTVTQSDSLTAQTPQLKAARDQLATSPCATPNPPVLEPTISISDTAPSQITCFRRGFDLEREQTLNPGYTFYRPDKVNPFDHKHPYSQDAHMIRRYNRSFIGLFGFAQPPETYQLRSGEFTTTLTRMHLHRASPVLAEVAQLDSGSAGSCRPPSTSGIDKASANGKNLAVAEEASLIRHDSEAEPQPLKLGTKTPQPNSGRTLSECDLAKTLSRNETNDSNFRDAHNVDVAKFLEEYKEF